MNNFFTWLWRIAILAALLGNIYAIKDLSHNRTWPERLTEVNHNRYDVAVYDGGNIVLPKDGK